MSLYDALNKLWEKEGEQAIARKENIIRFLKDNIEPYKDQFDGIVYRAAVYLTDGTYLPCVIFRNRESRVNYANRVIRNRQINKWFSSKSAKKRNNFFVEDLFVGDNQIRFGDIDKVEKSKYAFPNSILKQIEVPVMVGSGFAVKMKDGKYVGFHSNTGADHFFTMPIAYTVDDIVEIILDGYVFEDGQMHIIKHKDCETKNMEGVVFYEPHLYFSCYIDI